MNNLIPVFAVFGAKYLVFISIAIAGAYFIKVEKKLKRKIFIFSVVTFPLILLIATLASQTYVDPRPFVVGHFTPLIPHAPDNGFPSDHALLASAIAAVFSLFHRRLAMVLWIIAILVAYSRVYVGVHHPIDVIGSIIISILVTLIISIIIKKKFPQFFNK